ncbi:ABC transporter substrate-binding protein [Actinoallomurus liliacearum]|uniref:ABC transporter substrate-binding protein n=1 Tax=Actinoallomurus liliacearum TaxID=1080073 RepID=A0ABP8TBP1_9ACTN
MKLVIGRDDLARAAVEATGAERLNVKPVHKASKDFVNDQAVDLAELAIVTLLQAVAYGRPVVLLPVTTLGRFQHQTLVTIGGLTAGDVEGHSVGVRSWSQTTGVWMRGFLTEQYGVDLREVRWVTYEGAHVEGARDPDFVTRAPEGAKLQADFLERRLDFGIMGNELPADDRIRTAIADAHEVAAEWSRANGFAPVNHVLGVTEQAAREHSAAVCAAYDAMREVVESGPRDTGPVDLNPVGFAALRGPISRAAAYALDQGVLPRPVEFDELVAASCAALGVPAARLGG